MPLADIAHPRSSGAKKSVGLPKGQSSDWRFPPEFDCAGMHAREYIDRWDVHVDSVHPECSIADHIRTDAPAVWLAGGTAIGLGVGFLFGHPVIGSIAGLLFASWTVRPK